MRPNSRWQLGELKVNFKRDFSFNLFHIEELKTTTLNLIESEILFSVL